jgi:hemolysin III
MIDARLVQKPLWRGRLHQIAFICSIPMGMVIVAIGRSGAARAAAAIYAVSLCALYGVSASYHRIAWSERARRVMRRLDHSTIFVLIAGTYTPFCVLTLHGAWRIAMLSSVWGIALAGIVLKVAFLERLKALGFVLYIGLGWVAVAAIPQIVRALHVSGTTLLVAGGLLYTVGAIMFGMHRPDPRPAVFGYHEVWHSFVIAGSLCHYALIASLAIRTN